MENLVCRICLHPDGNSEYFTTDTEIKGYQLLDMLESFMPEMNLDISTEGAVLCRECCQKLEIACFFKEQCWSTEQRIYRYLKINNIREGGKITLKHLIRCEKGILETDELVIKEESDNECCDNVDEGSLVDKETEGHYEEEIDQHESFEENETHEKKQQVDLKRSHSCDQCEYKAYRLDLLVRHVRRNHASKTREGQLFNCHLCGYSTNRHRHLHRHYFTHNKESPHICSLCSKSFAEKFQLTSHMDKHAQVGEKARHRCKRCNRTYASEAYLKEHTSKCYNVQRRSVECYECKEAFWDKRGLTAHLATHQEIDHAYCCANCDFKTHWKNNLIRHVQNNGH